MVLLSLHPRTQSRTGRSVGEKLPEEEKVAIVRNGFREVEWGNREEVYPITSSSIEDEKISWF